MEVITPKTLASALKNFREKADERWVDEAELTEMAQGIVDEYLENTAGLSEDDLSDILAPQETPDDQGDDPVIGG